MPTTSIKIRLPKHPSLIPATLGPMILDTYAIQCVPQHWHYDGPSRQAKKPSAGHCQPSLPQPRQRGGSGLIFVAVRVIYLSCFWGCSLQSGSFHWLIMAGWLKIQLCDWIKSSLSFGKFVVMPTERLLKAMIMMLGRISAFHIKCFGKCRKNLQVKLNLFIWMYLRSCPLSWYLKSSWQAFLEQIPFIFNAGCYKTPL